MGLTEAKLKYFADFIQKEIGIIYGLQVYFQLEQRLEKIATYLGLASTDEVYAKAVKEGIAGDFKQFLLDIATNNETSFFRDPKVFDAIQNHILPNLKKDFPNAFSYRIWCAAASFGQEPYSIAMLVHEFMKANPGHPRIEILATDIADHALKRCREARYSQLEVQRGLSAIRLVQYFTKDEDGSWSLKPEIRNMVDFRKQNLLDTFQALGSFHLVSCRYVLIYQDTDKKKEIFQRLERTIFPKGHLILGGSESAMGLATDLDQISLTGAIFYQKKS